MGKHYSQAINDELSLGHSRRGRHHLIIHTKKGGRHVKAQLIKLSLGHSRRGRHHLFIHIMVHKKRGASLIVKALLAGHIY